MKSKNPKIQNFRKKALITVATALIIVTTLLIVLEATNSNYKVSNLVKENSIETVGTYTEKMLSNEPNSRIPGGYTTISIEQINQYREPGTLYFNKPICLTKARTTTDTSTQYYVQKESFNARTFVYVENINLGCGGAAGYKKKNAYIAQEGHYRVVRAGNGETKDMFSITLDMTLPTVTLDKSYGNNGFEYDADKDQTIFRLKYTDNLSGFSGKIYSVNRDDDWTYGNIGKTDFTFRVYLSAKSTDTEETFKVFDRSGNATTIKITVPKAGKTTYQGPITGTPTADTTKPTISSFEVLKVEEKDYSNTSLTLKATASDNKGLKGYMFSTNANLTPQAITWNKFENVEGTYTASQEITENGDWYFYAADESGNWIRSDALKVDKIDKIAPVITKVTKDTDWVKGKVEISINVKDEGSGLGWYFFGRQEELSLESDTLFDKVTMGQQFASIFSKLKEFENKGPKDAAIKVEAFEDGQYVFIAADLAENLSEMKIIEVKTIDNELPIIVQFSQNTTMPTLAPLKFDIQVADDESGLKGIQLNQKSTPDEDENKWINISGKKSYQNNSLKATKNDIYYLHVKDEVGNISSKSIRVSNIVSEISEEIAYQLNVDEVTGKKYINKNFIPITDRTDIKRVILDNKTNKTIKGYWLGAVNNAGLISAYDTDDRYPTISAADARMALRLSVGLENETIQKYSADIDGDGVISSSDARHILRMSVDLEDEYTIKNRKNLLPAIIDEGIYELQLTAIKSDTERQDLKYDIILDKTVPEVKLTLEDNEENDGYIIVATAVDKLSGIVAYQFTEMKPLEDNWTQINATTQEIRQEYVLTGEINDLYFYVKDAAGNVNYANFLNGNGEHEDDMSPEIVNLEYMGVQQSSAQRKENKITINFLGIASDDNGITHYQMSQDGNLTPTSSGWKAITLNKSLGQEVSIEVDLDEIDYDGQKDEENYFYIKAIKYEDPNEDESHVQIEVPVYKYYFYVKDETGNYSVRRLFSSEFKDTQKPKVIYVTKKGENRKINSEILTVYATDFENGSGLKSIRFTKEEGQDNDWELIIPEIDWDLEAPKRTEHRYIKEITENNDNLRIYVKDMKDNISNVFNVEVKNIVQKVQSGDVTINYEGELRIGTTIIPTIVNEKEREIPSISFTSSNKNIATVDAFGKVTGIARGEVEITATVTNYDGTTVEVFKENIKVLDKPLSIIQDPSSYENLDYVEAVPQVAKFMMRAVEPEPEEDNLIAVIVENEEVQLRIETEGTNVQYQWYKNTTNSNKGGTKIEGATSNVLTLKINEIDITKKYYYYCEVSNQSGENGSTVKLTSEAAEVAIYTKPEKPEIKVVDRYGNIIENGKYSNTEIYVTVSSEEELVGVGQVGYKYSVDGENWNEYRNEFEFDVDGLTTLQVKSYNKANEAIESEIATFDIIIDKERPTVEITRNVLDITNKDEIELTFTWNEMVEGFTEDDITLINATKGKLSRVTVDENGRYIYTMNIKTNTLSGNVEEVKVIIEEDKCIDIVAKTNVRSENTIKIDKQAPIFISLEAEGKSNVKLDKEVDTVKQYYTAMDQVLIIATFSENIENSELPTLELEFSESGNAKGSMREPVKAGNKILYTYPVSFNDKGTLSVKGFNGEVIDVAGNTTTVTKRELAGDTIIVDTAGPILTSLTANLENGKYMAEQQIKIEATFDEPIYAKVQVEDKLGEFVIENITSELAPILKIKFGEGEEREAIFEGYVENDKTKLQYSLTIEEGDNGNLSIVSWRNKENISACDIAGNGASLATRLNDTIIADTEKPKVQNITAEGISTVNGIVQGNTGFYKEGSTVNVTIESNEPIATDVITVKYAFKDTEPSDDEFKLDTEGHLNTENSNLYNFTINIEDGDNGFLWIKVDEDAYTDVAGNGNELKEPTKILNIYADTTDPRLTINEGEKSQLKMEYVKNEKGQAVAVKVIGIFNEKIFSMDEDGIAPLNEIPTLGILVNNSVEKTYNNPKIEILLNNEETELDDQTILTYEVDIKDIDTTADIDVNLINGTVYDRAGNKMTIRLSDGDITSPIFKDVKIVTPNDFYKFNDTIEIVARFAEKTELVKMPKLKVSIGDRIEELVGEYKADDPENTDDIKVARYTLKVNNKDNDSLNIISLIGNVSDGVRERDISKIFKDLPETEENDVNAKPEELLSSDGTAYPNGDEEYKNIITDNIKPYITNVKVTEEGNFNKIATYTKENEKEAITTVGKTNANVIRYEVEFSELIETVDESKIQIYNGKIEKIDYNKGKHFNKITITATTTIEGVQSLIILDGAIADRARNTNLVERFNMVTTDFTKPTVRFISEYNSGVYVLPTNIGKVEIRPNIEIDEEINTVEYRWDKKVGSTLVEIKPYSKVENYKSSSSDIAIPSIAFSENGEYQLSIRVTDLAGNETISYKVYKIVNESIKISTDLRTDTNQNITATVQFASSKLTNYLTENRKVMFKAVDSDEFVALKAVGVDENGGIQYTIKTNGVIYAEATDKIGNKVYAEYTISNIDKEKPKIDIELNGANLVIGTGKEKAKIKTKVNKSDNKYVAEAKYAFLQENYDIYKMTEEQKETISNTLLTQVSIDVEATKGKPYYLYVIAKDRAGNETIVKSNPFTVVDTNPDTKIVMVEGENGLEEREEIIPAEKPVEELIIFEKREEEIKDQAYVYVDYDYEIIQELFITLKNKYGDIHNNSVLLYGNTTIQVRALDACGNEIISEYEVTDIEGPELTILGNPKDWTDSDVDLEIYSEVELKTLTLNGKNILGDNKYIIDTTISNHGTYTIKAKDKYNNESEKEIEVKIDKLDPEITEVKVEGSKIIITANDIDKQSNKELSGIREYAISTSTELPIEWSKSSEIEVTEDGTYYVWVKDNVGHVTRAENTVTVDTVPLKLEITQNTTEWTNKDVELLIKANKALTSLKMGETEVDQSNKIVTIKENGEYRITAMADKHIAMERIFISNIDKVKPEITEVKVEGSKIIITANDIDKELKKELSGIKEYAISTSTEEPVEWSKSNIIEVTEDGTYYAWTKDKAGNVSMSTDTVTVNTVELELEITGNPTKWTNEDVELVIKTNKELSSLKMGETEVDLSNKIVTITENGEYVFTAVDTTGKVASSTVKVTKIDKTMPEITKVENAGRKITITAEDSLSGVKEYAISTSTEIPTEWSKSNVIEVAKDGIFYAWVKDKAENAVLAKTITQEGAETITQVIVDTIAPTVTFNYTLLTVVGGVPIEANIITNEESIISYSWDGKTWTDSEGLTTNVRVDKKYDMTGKYTLQAKATDKFGNESTVQTIEFTVTKPEDVLDPQIIFVDLPTIQVGGINYVKVAADMTVEDLTNKMNKDALCGVTPEYVELAEENKVKTGSEIKLNGDSKYVIIVNGDVNCDGKVSPIDVTYANSIRLNKVNANAIQKLAADFDADGVVKPIDITMINSYRLGKIKGI